MTNCNNELGNIYKSLATVDEESMELGTVSEPEEEGNQPEPTPTTGGFNQQRNIVATEEDARPLRSDKPSQICVYNRIVERFKACKQKLENITKDYYMIFSGEKMIIYYRSIQYYKEFIRIFKVTVKKQPLKLPKMVAVERIINIPIVESSWKYAGNIYNKIKHSNNLFTWTLDRAEDSIYNVLDTASPAILLIERPLNAIDKVLCESLNVVEERVPFITLPPRVIYHNTKEYVVRPVLKRADSVKQIGNSVLSSKYTAYAADKLDGALDLADKYVDKYLPDDVVDSKGNDEVDGKHTSPTTNKAIQTIQHMDRLSRKLQRRLTKRTLAEAKALKVQSAEAIHVLAYVAKLIVTDPKLALEKGKELWATLSQDEPENQARPENLEQLTVLLVRESARRVVHLVNFTTNTVGKLPRSVAVYAKKSADECLLIIRSVIKTVHLDDDQQAISDGDKNRTKTSLLKQINIYATNTLEHLAAILAEIQQSTQQEQQQQQQDQQPQSKKPIPQTTITNPRNQTYQLRQPYATLQPPSSPKAHFKATHGHIVNGENAVENASS